MGNVMILVEFYGGPFDGQKDSVPEDIVKSGALVIPVIKGFDDVFVHDPGYAHPGMATFTYYIYHMKIVIGTYRLYKWVASPNGQEETIREVMRLAGWEPY